jgi:hypothetical protein
MTTKIWEPLPDGKYERPNWDGNGTLITAVLCDGTELEQWHSSNDKAVDEISLGNLRLCRLVDVPDAPPAPSAEVVATIREALPLARKYINATELTFDTERVAKIKRIDAALTWLATLTPTEGDRTLTDERREALFQYLYHHGVSDQTPPRVAAAYEVLRAWSAQVDATTEADDA